MIGGFLFSALMLGCFGSGSSGGGGSDADGEDDGQSVVDPDAGLDENGVSDDTPTDDVSTDPHESEPDVDSDPVIVPDLGEDQTSFDAEVDQACVTSLSATGTIRAVDLGTDLDVSQAVTTAAMVHRQDVDPLDGGCIARFDVSFSFHDGGCELVMTFGSKSDGYGGLLDVSFAADSFCPNFPDEEEGTYQIGWQDFGYDLYLAEWFTGVSAVEDHDAARSCLENVEIRLPQTTLWMIRQTDGQFLKLSLEGLTLTGVIQSEGNPDARCVDTNTCSRGYHDGGNGYCTIDGMCWWENGLTSDGGCCPEAWLVNDDPEDGPYLGIETETGDILAMCFNPQQVGGPFHLDAIDLVSANADPDGAFLEIELHLYSTEGEGPVGEPTSLGSVWFGSTPPGGLHWLEDPIELNAPFCIGAENIRGRPMIGADNTLDHANDNWAFFDGQWWQVSTLDVGVGDFAIRAVGAVCEP